MAQQSTTALARRLAQVRKQPVTPPMPEWRRRAIEQSQGRWIAVRDTTGLVIR